MLFIVTDVGKHGISVALALKRYRQAIGFVQNARR